MKEKDNIKDLFSEKLGNYEAKVDSKMWSNISAQIGSAASTSAASTGLSLLTKAIIGTVVTAAVVTGVVILTKSESQEKPAKQNPVAVVVNTPQESSQTETIIKQEEPANGESNTIERGVVPNETLPETPSPVEHTSQEESSHISPPINEGAYIPPVDTEESEHYSDENNGTGIIETNDVGVNEVDSGDTSEKDEVLIEELKEEKAVKLHLPDIFTPNNDGDNDYLNLEGLNSQSVLDGLKEFQLVVMDNKNRIVYKSDDPHFQWDGIAMDGTISPDGYYIYFATAVDKNGNPVLGKETLQIKRTR